MLSSVDLFVLVASPTGGDELQGIKRGIMELADLIIVNKADGELADAARRACSDLRKAVHLLRPKRPGWEVDVHMGSALTGDGVPELWDALFVLARLLDKMGRRDKAFAAYDEFLEAADQGKRPEDELHQQALTRYRELRDEIEAARKGGGGFFKKLFGKK